MGGGGTGREVAFPGNKLVLRIIYPRAQGNEKKRLADSACVGNICTKKLGKGAALNGQ